MARVPVVVMLMSRSATPLDDGEYGTVEMIRTPSVCGWESDKENRSIPSDFWSNIYTTQSLSSVSYHCQQHGYFHLSFQAPHT